MDGRFGFIHTKLEIKTLILYCLARLPLPVDQDTLAKIAICDDGISFFEFAECLADLVVTEHVTETDAGYAITELGRHNGEITATSLPYTVKLKAEQAARETSKALTRSALIKASHSLQRRGGCTVELSMSDGIGEVLKMELLAMNEDQAKRIEKNFEANAENLYLKLIELLDQE